MQIILLLFTFQSEICFIIVILRATTHSLFDKLVKAHIAALNSDD